MRDASPWSLNIMRLGGVPVRLHASCLVAAVAAVYIASMPGHDGDQTGYGFLAAAIWILSLLAHQLGHLLVAARYGAPVERIVVGPLGDLAPIRVPHDPHRELLVALGGPLAQVLVLIVVTPALIMSGEDLRELMFAPLGPTNLVTGGLWLAGLKLFFWCNWVLLLVNLLPALPLDAGQALRAGLRPLLGEPNATLMVTRAGALITIGGLTIWSVLGPSTGVAVPVWVPLTLVCLLLFFWARAELLQLEGDDGEEDLLGYDFSQGYTSLERGGETIRPREPGFIQRWLQQRRLQKSLRARQIEEDEERRVDEILARVKDAGMDSLAPEERALLNRVSARYRNRLSH